MKPVDNQLERLLKSAAAAPKPSPTAAVFTLEARVMGGWRGLSRSEGGESLLALFRRAAIFACMLALASLAWNHHERTRQTGAELAIADSAMSMGVEP